MIRYVACLEDNRSIKSWQDHLLAFRERTVPKLEVSTILFVPGRSHVEV